MLAAICNVTGKPRDVIKNYLKDKTKAQKDALAASREVQGRSGEAQGRPRGDEAEDRHGCDGGRNRSARRRREPGVICQPKALRGRKADTDPGLGSGGLQAPPSKGVGLVVACTTTVCRNWVDTGGFLRHNNRY